MPKKPKFPGFQECLRMMRKRDPETFEDGFYRLVPYAREYVHELMAEFCNETGPDIRWALLELIGYAKSPEALPLLVEVLHGDNDDLRGWAIRGLQDLDTKEARQVLWDAGLHPDQRPGARTLKGATKP
jgi:HEAT repeat protein